MEDLTKTNVKLINTEFYRQVKDEDRTKYWN